jgi:N-acetylglutamate synthase-like GNAT family acetyltransferase
MPIEYLADHPGAAPLLAAWHYGEWKELLPDWTLERALTELQSHTGRRQIPTTFVAVEQGQVVGSASLLADDLDGWEHLTPWVASVYVLGEWRGRGLGRLLVGRAVEEARALGVPKVYLFTAGQEGYYARLGWSEFARARHHRHEVVIMRRATGLPEPRHRSGPTRRAASSAKRSTAVRDRHAARSSRSERSR